MCGLVGADGTAARVLVDAAAAEAALRGPHSHGWAWWADGWSTRLGPGPLPMPPTADGPLIGHSRLATSGGTPGDRPATAEGQPLTGGGYVVAHNGTVEDPDTLAGRPVVVDSEAIVAALAAGMPLADVVARLGPAPQAIIVGTPDGRLIAVRSPGRHRPAHPLWALAAPGGTVVCSRPFTAGCRPLPEGITAL